MPDNIGKQYTANVEEEAVGLILSEIDEAKNAILELSDKAEKCPYEEMQDVLTHRANAFLTPLAEGQEDTRQFFDVVTQATETASTKAEVDTKDIDLKTTNNEYPDLVMISKPMVNNYFKYSSFAEFINATKEEMIDLGNVVARKTGKGEIVKKVRLEDLYIVDPSAETLEDTTVIERNTMSQYSLMKMKEWKVSSDIIKKCNISGGKKTPYYDVFMRFGQIERGKLNYLKASISGGEYNETDNDDEYVESQIIIIRAKTHKSSKLKGYVVFASELIPDKYKISPHLEIEKYKPYEEGHFGTFEGCWYRKGYRLIGMPYQNRANDLGNKIDAMLEIGSRVVWHSSDTKVAGMNVLSNLQDGDIIISDDLTVLNNQLPNLAILANEWNRNINDLRQALKSFEVATGEALPSSTSATAVAVQNQSVGEYYDYKREKYGIFLRHILNRFILPEVLKKANLAQILEITGDADYTRSFIDAAAKGLVFEKVLIPAALEGKTISGSQYKQFLAYAKEQFASLPQLLLETGENMFKQAPLFLDFNVTNEQINKQAKVSNALSLIPLVGPANKQKLIEEVASATGIRLIQEEAPRPEMATQSAKSPEITV
jgi:hypothetical protein